MREILIGLTLVLAAVPAAAQAPAQSDYDICYSPTATDDATIASCTNLIASGRYSGQDLSFLYNNRADGYDGKSEWDLAILDDNMAIQLDPTNAQAFNNRSEAYVGKGLYDEAIADGTQALALKPGYGHAYDNRGEAYEKKGMRDQAISDFRASLSFNSNDSSAIDGLKRLGVTP